MENTTKSTHDILAEADKLCEIGKYKEASVKYESVLKSQDNPLVMMKLSECYFQLNNFDKAKVTLEQAEKTLTNFTPRDKEVARKLKVRLYHNLA